MHEETVIIKEEIDIDDTKIKLEMDEDEDAAAMELSCAGALMKIIEERPNMITVPVHDYKSEDELKFIASLNTLDQQPKLFVTSACEIDEYQCKICNFMCENHLALASHQMNHQLNRHFCFHGCGFWCNTLEEILEHEYRLHDDGLNSFNCRICLLGFQDAESLASHMSSHSYLRRFVCAICRRYFESGQGLQLHRQHSKEPCGRVDYVDTHSNVGQLVAISKLNDPLSAELLCDVEIKSEPFDPDEQQKELHPDLAEVIIKTEPKEEPEGFCASSSITWPSVCNTSLPEQLRGKLRLPAIKKPLKAEPPSKAQQVVHATPTIQFVPVEKWNPTPKPISIASAKRPNILKPMKASNQRQATSTLKKNIVHAPKSNPNVASNILKVLPSNCMVFKLPPNTKIIKIPPTTSTTTSGNTNSCSVGSKIITLPNAMTISGGSTTAVPCSDAAKLPQKGSLTPINRNAYFSDLSLFEKLPESRKIIADFQNQIRSIEQTCPLPGSVLQTPKKSSSGVLPTQLQVLKLPPTEMSHITVREMRNTYPDHRFYWECPNCARCFEQYLAFCNHLIYVHSIPKTDFDHMEVEVKTYKKINSIAPNVTDTELHNSVEDTSNMPKTAVPSLLTSAVPAAEAASCDVPTAKDTVPPIPANKIKSPPPASSIVETTVKSVEASVTPASTGATKTGRSSGQSRPAQFQCADCSKCFTTVGALRIHKMIHTGELPHKCDYCDKRFRTPGQVRVHQRRHTGEKPFKCKVCSLDFTHRETLISHLSRHIGMKRYKCYGCDKNFVVVSGLRAHRRLRPDTCGKVKFTARAHGPRVRVIRGEVIFESHPEHNGYLRSEDPLNILSEISQLDKESSVPSDAVS